ncbi:stage II sporulation protein R [Paenibacillus radicis (ex Xue et al. 2023)]|uniref:Stage II sporulation protein R n=1 Tax=Paenibacillus radicis (ex Xue et al. 2023) TaxID=2972489 RepID=A0ABT1YGI1_9BACL|nr:stage II sporulation protein R [Paenibacillus radicis (ex Xue et al. 2023)]MCR8632305.1 stage II sporulation protein R [Paenibacillus radicis (ex Xue et al. 2023)]
MVKRTSWKRYVYIVFALILLITCWEANREQGVVLASGVNQASEGSGEVIPQQSIRLRILANSDSPADQWIKREVRDAIVEQMNEWVDEPQGIEEARVIVRNHLSELNELVGKTLRQNGFSYSYEAELGVVPFPAKMYGNQIYPAGDYEALRVSIGTAEGQNWWCVLFPPLCFVNSEAIVKKTNAADAELNASVNKENSSSQDKKMQTGKGNKTEAADGAIDKKATAKVSVKDGHAQAANGIQTSAEQPEVRFFLWDMLKKLGSLFA